MFGKQLTEWQQLCFEASTEQDGDKLLLLIREINRLLAEEHDSLKLRARIVGKRTIAIEREQAS